MEDNKLSTDENEVAVDRIEVAGIITDAQGHSWTLPEKDSDIGDLYKSPFSIKGHPEFYYQFETKDNVPQMLADEFVTVTRKELGLDRYKDGSTEYGQGTDEVYTVGNDMVCLKIPKVLADRRKKTERDFAKLAVDATKNKKKSSDEPESGGNARASEREALNRMRANQGGQRRTEMQHKVLHVRPKNEETDKVSE